MKRRAVLAAVVVLAAALGACSRGIDERRRAPNVCPCADAGTPIDPVLLAFLARARTAHHLADGFEEGHEIERAIDALHRVIDGPIPGAAHPAAEVREVLADTRARLADLSSQLGRFDEAARQVDVGLGAVPETSFYRGHLFEVRGVLEQRRAKALRAAGDETAARAAERRAVEASETSMEIQAEVIRNAAPASSTIPPPSSSVPR